MASWTGPAVSSYLRVQTVWESSAVGPALGPVWPSARALWAPVMCPVRPDLHAPGRFLASQGPWRPSSEKGPLTGSSLMGFNLSLLHPRLQLLCLCMGKEWLPGLGGPSAPQLEAGGQSLRAGQYALPQLAWASPPSPPRRSRKNSDPFPGGKGHSLSPTCLWVAELSFTWQQFVIDLHLQQKKKKKKTKIKTNGLLFLCACSFWRCFPSALFWKKISINKLLVSLALLVNSFLVSPLPPTKPQLYGAGMQFRTWEEGDAAKYVISFVILMVLLWLLSFSTLVATMLLSPDRVYRVWKFLSKSK